ncbi:insulinase family protein [Alloacidobacterium dinghuense]|uniref:Insulinase family protein n=2 Tax=Alloacidobacterium dinghuense TaxID=2763107 RepID=A0A7G8BQV1_9BACT|nr:insulinase family protein [Alloacidobacterium dinghuense]
MLLGLTVLVALSTLAQSAHAQQPQPWTQIPVPPLHPFHPQQPKRIELKNGLVIMLQEDHELPFINGFIEMRGGSRDEPANKAGLIDLYSDAWRTSGTASKNGDELDDLLEAKAAKVETGGDTDSTSLSWSCLTKDEDLVFGIAVDLLEHPAFKEDKLMLAKQQAAAGIVRRNDDASAIAGREAAKLVYGANSPYTREPELATIKAVTLDDLKQWHDKTIVPNNMIIGVEGDFDAAQMEKTLRAAFENLPRGTPWPKPSGEFPGPKPGVYIVDKTDVNQSNVNILGIGTLRSNPDYFALSVMNEIFSGGFGSRLFQDVRTKQGLAYSVGGGYGSSYDHPGMFKVGAGTKSASTIKATQAMVAEIGDLKTKPFTEEELKRAKDQVLNSFIFNYDTKEKVLAAAARLEFYGYPADFLERYRDGVEHVTTADLERVAKKYIDTSKLAVLIVGNQQEFGAPLTELGMGAPHAVDITIPGAPQQSQGGNEGEQ